MNGFLLKHVRQFIGLLQQELAEFAGMARLTVQKQLKKDNLILVGNGTGKAPNSYKLNLK